MKTWAAVFAKDLRFVVKATVAVIRHHLTARPHYASAEWQIFIEYLERDFNYRHGHSDNRPAPYSAPWSVGYPRIADKPALSLSSLPVTPWPWPSGMVLQ